MYRLVIAPADVPRVVCETLRVDAQGARLAANLGPMRLHVGGGTTVGGDFDVACFLLAWVEGRLAVLRLPGADLSGFGDVVGYSTTGEGATMWVGVKDPAVVAALRRRFVR